MDEGSDVLSDYEYDRNGQDDNDQFEDIDAMYSRYENYEEEESRLDEDLEPEFRDGENKECL